MLTFGQKPKVLMVDDDETNHLLYQQAFENKGFDIKILEHADGSFADVVANYQPHIISMDLMIGKEGVEVERDGFQAIEALKADERTKHIPVIVLTNFHQEYRVNQAKELGVIDYINLHAYEVSSLPDFFKRYLSKPNKYVPSHEAFRK